MPRFIFKRELKMPKGYRRVRMGEIIPEGAYYEHRRLFRNKFNKWQIAYEYKEFRKFYDSIRMSSNILPTICKKNPNVADL